MRFAGLTFKQAAERIERVIGEAREVVPITRDREQTRTALNELWRRAAPVTAGDATDKWLCARGVGLDIYPRSLRTVARVQYRGDEGVSYHPAMLAIVTGEPATIHRTYLTNDGRKAPVTTPRKLFSEVAKGAAVRLTPPAAALGIAEGVETALAASKLFAVPTWAALCANMLAKFEPPIETKRLTIFGDNDAGGVGQGAAYALASRLAARLQVDVKLPRHVDTDWNDVLLTGDGG
jgi:putative DNA primase/helicase